MTIHLSKPDGGRVVDYWLGGHNNFLVDRLVAHQVEAILPDVPEFQCRHREFLKRAVAFLVKQKGLNRFIDFGSGLPTCGNVHEIALALDSSARVVYSDISPTTVAYGREILAITNPDNVRHEQCDAGHPEELLTSTAVEEMLGEERRVGIGFSHLPHLLTDDDLAHALKALYEWAEEGSYIMFSFMNEKIRDHPALFRVMTGPGKLFPRSKDEFLALLGRWRVTEHGITLGTAWPEDGPVTGITDACSYACLAYKQRNEASQDIDCG